MFSDGTTTDAGGYRKEENSKVEHRGITKTTSKSIKLKKMQPRTRNLSVPLSRSKSEKNNNAKGIKIEVNNCTSQMGFYSYLSDSND